MKIQQGDGRLGARERAQLLFGLPKQKFGWSPYLPVSLLNSHCSLLALLKRM